MAKRTKKPLDVEPLLVIPSKKGISLVFMEAVSGRADGAFMAGVMEADGHFTGVEIRDGDAIAIAKLCLCRAEPLLVEILDRIGRDEELTRKVVELVFPELPA